MVDNYLSGRGHVDKAFVSGNAKCVDYGLLPLPLLPHPLPPLWVWLCSTIFTCSSEVY